MTRQWHLDYEQHHKAWVEDVTARVPLGTAAVHNIAFCLWDGSETYTSPYKDIVSEVTDISGGMELYQLRGVYLPTGNEVLPHEHLSMRVLLYMPMYSGASLGFSGPTEKFPTVAGTLTDIEPGRSHWVTRNPGPPRVTMAFMFNV